MHIEDLLALLKFIRTEEKFAKKITWYRANEVTGKFLKNLESELYNNPDRVLNYFLIPNRISIETYLDKLSKSDVELPNIEHYDFGTNSLLSYIKQILKTYKKIKSSYEQYKHGLKIRLKDIKINRNSSLIEENNHIRGFILSLHNDTWKDGLINGRIQEGVMCISFSDFIQNHSKELMSDKNLFQYDLPHDINIDYIIEIAKKTTELILNVVRNRMDYIKPNLPEYRTIYLPYPKDNLELYYFYLGKINGKLIELDSFN